MGTQQYSFKYKGKTYHADAPVLTPEQLYGLIGASRDARTRLIFVKGTTARPMDGNIDVREAGALEEIPTATRKGANLDLEQRSLYIKAQAATIAEVYGERYGLPVQLDRRLTYLFIPRFPLPRRWGERETPILIRIPDKYPEVPPHGFWLSSNCRGPHVFARDVYGELEDVHPLGWNWFCVHCDDGWKPGPSPLEPDNLWTFLNVIRTALSVNEF